MSHQPFVKIITDMGCTQSGFARSIGFDPGYVMRVGSGITAPSQPLLDTLVDVLGRPATALFSPDVLKRRYLVRSNSRGLGGAA